MNKLLQTFPWLRSSVDPTKASLTVKGLIVFIPAAVTLASYFGAHLQADSLTELVNQLAVVASAGATFWGLIRKSFNTTGTP